MDNVGITNLQSATTPSRPRQQCQRKQEHHTCDPMMETAKAQLARSAVRAARSPRLWRIPSALVTEKTARGASANQQAHIIPSSV